MKKTTHVKKGDIVEVISGNYKGKRGKVQRVYPENGRIAVEGTVLNTRHLKYNRQTKEGGRVKKEGTVDISNVQLVCPKCNAPSKSGVKVLENKSKVRVCKKCNNDIVYTS